MAKHPEVSMCTFYDNRVKQEISTILLFYAVSYSLYNKIFYYGRKKDVKTENVKRDGSLVTLRGTNKYTIQQKFLLFELGIFVPSSNSEVCV